MPIRFTLPVLFAFILFASACTSTQSVPATTSNANTSTPTNAANTVELEERFWAQQDAAKTRFTEADVKFMTGMIGHHAQALVMSAFAPTNGANPEVQTLAARIINAQKDEIATMQQWLRDRGQPVPEIHIEGTKLMIHGVDGHGGGHGHGDHMNMPGMLTQAQLDELAAAQGGAFDRLFLKYMIDHHAGAITMVDELFATDGAGQDEASFKLASDINVDQITEIARMERMLRALEQADQ